MAASRRRARPGAVLEMRTARGLAYVQYAGRHPRYGDAIRVLPGFFQERPADCSGLLTQEGYFTFYPVSAAVSQGLVEVAAQLPIPPGAELPARYRRAGWTTPEGKVTTWFICEEGHESRRTVLSAEERRLFIADIWNHEFLLERLAEEWHPRQEPAEQPAPEVPPRPEGPPATAGGGHASLLTHYLYCPSREAGEALAVAVKALGFEVEHTRSTEEERWLVLASHSLTTPEQLPSIRAELEELAQRYAGQYDGWQAGGPR